MMFPRLQAAKVLVVEDDLVVRDLILTQLDFAGYKTAEAHDGREALSRWETFFPNLAIIDINMPNLDGFDLLASLGERGFLVRTPVIVVTSRNLEIDFERARALGASSYVVKPFDSKLLLQRVAKLLREARQPGVQAVHRR